MKTNITLRVDKKLYERYRAYAKDKGFYISRKFEIMMEEVLENGK